MLLMPVFCAVFQKTFQGEDNALVFQNHNKLPQHEQY